MSRFFVNLKNIGEKFITITEKEDIHHITRVLRLKTDDEIDISDCVEWEYRTVITNIESEYIEARILDKQKFAREPKIKITLFQGLPKQGKMELIIQKAVELGVFQIAPVFTDRSVVTDNGKMGKKIERWQKIADEAVKQCKRGIIPRILDEVKFKEMLNRLEKFDLVLFPYENEEKRTIKDSLHSLKKNPQNVAIIIGPEGGFSDQEAAALKVAGADCVTLGKTVLRTETAGFAAIAMTMYELEL
ncbi:MAG: 16S rRNA (uracil(1498)-N(3))-methyltransferase [Peptostreptococcaceae bacterium]|nr:16S rRNA (uracil(1498)-N(3))-methyltransferase [Peptostreptococcaceae bacterium]